jgi:hypothetical protein
MDKFEQKYGIEEDEKVKNFHRSRRMFCIYQNNLCVADQNLPYSHAAWFEKEGWMSKGRDELMDKIVRGIIDDKGDVYFYIGYDFRINSDIESIFFSHLKELVNVLKLDTNAHIFGGLIKSKSGGVWPPAKDYGKIKDNLM